MYSAFEKKRREHYHVAFHPLLLLFSFVALFDKQLPCVNKKCTMVSGFPSFANPFLHFNALLVEAHKLTTSREMLLWMTPSEAPKALQASECSELLDPMRASCWISAQH